MAPKIASSAGQNARDKLVQPVLPALPLLNRNKRHNGRTGGSGILSTNGNASSLQLPPSTRFEESAKIVMQLTDDGMQHKDGSNTIGCSRSDSLSGTRSPSVVPSELQDSVLSNSQPNDVPFLPESDASTAQSDRSLTEPSIQAASSTAHSTPAYVHQETVKDQDRRPNQHDLQDVSTPANQSSADNHDSEITSSQDTISTRARAISVNREEDAFLQPTANLTLNEAGEKLKPRTHSALGINGDKQNHNEKLFNGNTQPNQQPFYSARYPEISSRTHAQSTILDHMLHLANSKQSADWTLQINQPSSAIGPFVSLAHSVVLLRSETLRRVVSDSYHPNKPAPLLPLFPARNIQPHAFEAALRFLYSDTMLSTEAFFPHNTFMDKHARYHAVDCVLSYWVSAIELGIEPVKVRAFDILAAAIDWDIVELLVREASTLRAFTGPERERIVAENVLAANSIMGLVFDFLIRRISISHFKLDVTSQPNLMNTRLGQYEFGSTSSNPALAGMVFGSMPTSTAPSPAFSAEEQSYSTDAIVSHVLLNLDHHDLDVLARNLIGIHGIDGIRILTDVVDEREKRRLHIFHDRSINNRHRANNSAMWDVIGWREYVQDGQLRHEQITSANPSGKRGKQHAPQY